MRTFAIHIEGESNSPNLHELTSNFIETLRAEKETTVIRAANFSDHATSAEEGKSTLQQREVVSTLSEQQLFDQGHRKPAQLDETPPAEAVPA